MSQWFSFKLLRKRISKASNHSWYFHFWMPSLRYFKSISILKKCQNPTTADNQAPFRHLNLCNRKQRQPKSLLIYENLGFGLLKAYITFENWTQTLLKTLPIKKPVCCNEQVLFTVHKPHSLGSSDGPTVPSDGPTVLGLRCNEEVKSPHKQEPTLVCELLSTLSLLPTLCFGVRTLQGHQNQKVAVTRSGKTCFVHGKGSVQEAAPGHGRH